tara:strand:+ start:494 stop:913 length:420 start_codon:yes stop_codon:yes gene_type:complete
MAYKLGKAYKPYMTNGNLRTKMRFSQEAGSDASVPGTPVIRKPLAPGVMGEANMDGTIFISDKIVPGSKEEKEVLNHEMRHATDMRIGKLAYGDDFVKYDGTTYERKDINGKDMIIVDGIAKEAGDHDFPWENDANNGK